MMERISAKDYRALVAKPPAEPRDIKPPKKARKRARSEEHTSELQSLMRISYAVFCLKKKKTKLIQILIRALPYINKRHSKYKIHQHIPKTLKTKNAHKDNI